MKDPVANNIAAEMMALLNAMVAGRKSKLIRKLDNLLLQTDCQAAIDAFNGDRKSISKQEESLVDWFKTFTAEQQLHTTFKHVKGHTRNSEARFIVNRMCDRKARDHMRRARGHLRLTAMKEGLL